MTLRQTSLVLALALGASLRGSSAEVTLRPPRVPDISVRHEIQHAIDRGLGALLAAQNTNGWWSSPNHPAVTALALSAFMGEPTGRYRTNPPAPLRQGYTFIVDSAKPDGSIYRAGMLNYNTAISMMALLAANNPAYNDLLRRGRAFLVKSQIGLSPGTPGQRSRSRASWTRASARPT